MVNGRKSRRKYVFPIIYIIAALGAGVLGLLSSSFFAYGIVKHLWANILYLLFISTLYVTAYVQELLVKRKPTDVVFYSFVFLGSLLFFFLFYFLNVYFALIAIAYSAILACFLSFRFILRIRSTQTIPDDSDIDVKPAIAVFAIILFTMASMMGSISYLSEIYFAWALIPTAIIAIVIGGVILFILRDMYRAKFIPIRQSILVAVLGFFAVFAYCSTTIGLANFAFDYADPVPIECTVLDKNISGGSRSPTTHELKVKINDSDVKIEVTATQYYAVSKGDVITVNYHSGAFGFAYVIYDDATE